MLINKAKTHMKVFIDVNFYKMTKSRLITHDTNLNDNSFPAESLNSLTNFLK